MTFRSDETEGKTEVSEAKTREVPLLLEDVDITGTDAKIERRHAATPVTSRKKDSYVRLRVRRRVRGVAESSEALAARKGLAEVFPSEHPRVFSTAEVALLLGGAGKVDVEETRVRARVSGGYETSKRKHSERLWGFVRRRSEENRAFFFLKKFLKFVAVSSRVPP